MILIVNVITPIITKQEAKKKARKVGLGWRSQIAVHDRDKARLVLKTKFSALPLGWISPSVGAAAQVVFVTSSSIMDFSVRGGSRLLYVRCFSCFLLYRYTGSREKSQDQANKFRKFCRNRAAVIPHSLSFYTFKRIQMRISFFTLRPPHFHCFAPNQ